MCFLWCHHRSGSESIIAAEVCPGFTLRCVETLSSATQSFQEICEVISHSKAEKENEKYLDKDLHFEELGVIRNNTGT